MWQQVPSGTVFAHTAQSDRGSFAFAKEHEFIKTTVTV
jgi:hypothetical protein